jgi:hypothetical protein
MKLMLSSIFIFIAVCTSGQKIIINCDEYSTGKSDCNIRVSNLKKQPLLFLDSVLIPYCMLQSIDPNDILSIDVVKSGYNANLNTEGKIYITTKKKKKLNIYTIIDPNANDISASNILQLQKPKKSSGLIILNKK